MWILFTVPCPTPDGRSARDLYDKRVRMITPEMQTSPRDFGCLFHRAWYSADASTFYAVANWATREGATAFFEKWDIEAEPGEVAVRLEGDVGLTP